MFDAELKDQHHEKKKRHFDRISYLSLVEFLLRRLLIVIVKISFLICTQREHKKDMTYNQIPNKASLIWWSKQLTGGIKHFKSKVKKGLRKELLFYTMELHN